MSTQSISGGCQCGAVRFKVADLGNPSICHCRMCQKAFGNFFAPLVTCGSVEWTRGTPKWFQSSNKVRRGFCGDCGTPLSYDFGDDVEIAVGALDNPELAAPVIQVNPAEMVGFFQTLHALPVRDDAQSPDQMEFMSGIESYQHPDRDTTDWKAGGKS